MMDTDSIDSSTEKALIEGYTAISGQPLQEGLLSWLFGTKTTPSQELANKVNSIFEKFYESEGVRQQRFNARMSTSYSPYSQGIDRVTMDRIDSMRMAILREVSKYGKQLDRAVKDKEKAFKTRDNYSNKLDYMRDSRDDYRQRYQEQRKRKK
jgi:hypothetical protein